MATYRYFILNNREIGGEREFNGGEGFFAHNGRELRIASRLILDATRACLPSLLLPPPLSSQTTWEKVSAYRMKKKLERRVNPSIHHQYSSPEIFFPFFHPFTARISRGPVYSPILVLISQELLTYDGIEQLAGLRGFFK